jgi:hypothetical protein
MPPKTLAALIIEASTVLEDPLNAVFDTDTITQHLNNAVIEASRYVPAEAKETVTLAAGNTEISTSGIAGLRRIIKAEYPIDQTPRAFRNVRVFSDTVTIETDLAPMTGDKAYLFCEEARILTSGASTLTPELEPIVVNLAAGNAALNWLGAGRTQITATMASIASADNALGLMTADVARAITDLASVRANLTSMIAAVGAALGQVDARVDQAVTDIGNARVAFTATETAISTNIATLDTRITQALADLTSGRALINTITTGATPQAQYAQYAVSELNAASARMNEVKAYMSQGSNLANQLYNAANHELNVSGAYAAEGRALESQYSLAAANYGADASRELGAAGGHLSQAQGYIAEINSRLSVANVISGYQRWGQNKIDMALRQLRLMQKPRVVVGWTRG